MNHRRITNDHQAIKSNLNDKFIELQRNFEKLVQDLPDSESK